MGHTRGHLCCGPLLLPHHCLQPPPPKSLATGLDILAQGTDLHTTCTLFRLQGLGGGTDPTKLFENSSVVSLWLSQALETTQTFLSSVPIAALSVLLHSLGQATQGLEASPGNCGARGKQLMPLAGAVHYETIYRISGRLSKPPAPPPSRVQSRPCTAWTWVPCTEQKRWPRLCSRQGCRMEESRCHTIKAEQPQSKGQRLDSKISLGGPRGNQGKDAGHRAQDRANRSNVRTSHAHQETPCSWPGASRPVWSHVDCGSHFQTNSPSGEAGGWELLSWNLGWDRNGLGIYLECLQWAGQRHCYRYYSYDY